MPVTDDVKRVPVDSLWVNRDARQRREIFTSDGAFINKDGLLDSIKARGVLSPILAHRSGEIIFGERRWTGAKLAGHADVPVRFVEDMSEIEAKVIELEENARRADLPWRDRVRSIGQLHETYETQATQRGVDWSQKATAEALLYSTGQLAEILRVFEDLDDKRLERATSIREAYNALARVDERRSAEVMEEIITATAESMRDVGSGVMSPPSEGDGTIAGDHVGAASVGAGVFNAPRTALLDASTPYGPKSGPYPSDPARNDVAPTDALNSIICADFTQWSDTYAGPRFNLIHCDFPYGVNLFDGQWGGKGNVEAYEDTQETYVRLIEALCRNLDRVMSHSAHLVFWCSADFELLRKTRAMFAELAGDLWFWPMPLIWHKTDNMGIASDPQRRGRHVYEVALVASREDRKIVKVVSDCYGAPTDKRLHPSCKPEPVLKHFLSAFVDEHTRLLDPTCGSASALRAAESLGAESVLGLELNEDHAKTARSAMRQFRTLRAMERKES